MTCGVRTGAGVDLDTLFLGRTSAAAANCGIRTGAAQDLSDRFEPRGSSIKRADVGLRSGAGVDISNTFRDINSILFPATSPRTSSVIRTSGTSTSGYRLQSDGNVFICTAAGFVDGGDDWVDPVGQAANYSCKATLVSGTTPSTGTMGTVLVLTADRSWTNVQSVIGVKQSVMDIDIIRNSDSAVVDTIRVTIYSEISP